MIGSNTTSIWRFVEGHEPECIAHLSQMAAPPAAATACSSHAARGQPHRASIPRKTNVARLTPPFRRKSVHMTNEGQTRGDVGRSRTRSTLHARPVPQQAGRTALTIAALGVVFGDLGTSPLYTLQACFSGVHGIAPTEQNVLGVLSIVFWSLMLVITFKYLAFLMRTDNAGEGGIMALLALTPARLRRPPPGKVGPVAWLVIAGAALLFGDGIITPAVSVLSAVEGLEVASPALKQFVVPTTVTILLLLFAVQSRGTAKLGRLFGPVMLIWFLTLAGLGVYRIVGQPSVLVALSPGYAARYFLSHGLGGITILGGVVLCVTGGEALYADMGHFGRAPIQNGWLYVCLPSLVLNYFGQGALILSEHEPAARLAKASRPFYALCPEGVWVYGLVALATLATIIASQALISGVFSLTHQAIQLGYFPRLTVRHTSDDTEGQIYLPLMNWGLAFSCVVLVLMFQASDKLASAYGLAVSGTMAITSIVYFVVLRQTRKWPLWKAGLVVGLFLATDIPFLVANASKFWEGGYVPFAVALLFVVLMTNWRIGRSLSGELSRQAAEPLERLAVTLDERVKIRLPGRSCSCRRITWRRLLSVA